MIDVCFAVDEKTHLGMKKCRTVKNLSLWLHPSLTFASLEALVIQDNSDK